MIFRGQKKKKKDKIFLAVTPEEFRKLQTVQAHSFEAMEKKRNYWALVENKKINEVKRKEKKNDENIQVKRRRCIILRTRCGYLATPVADS